MTRETPLGRSFGGLWFATGAANLGDGVVLFALPLLALASGASDGLVALVTTLATLAWPLFGIHGGWLVDHLGARRILFWANAVRGVYLVGLAVAMLFGELEFWVVAIAALLYGVAEVLVDTSLVSAVPGTVRTSHRGRANARIEATITVSNEFAGAPLGGLLISLGHVFAVGAGGVLYLLALVGIAIMRPVSERPGTAPIAVVEPDRRVRAGMSFLWANATLRWLTLINAGMNLVWGMFMAVIVLYVVRPGPLDASAFAYGFVFTGMAVGGLIASVAYGWLRKRVGASVLLGFDTFGTLILVLAPALGVDYVWLLISGAVAAAGSSVWRILNSGIRQHLVPEYLLGRVYSASRVISWGALPIGSALAGLLVTVSGLNSVFVVASCVAGSMIVAFVVLAVLHPLKNADGFDQL